MTRLIAAAALILLAGCTSSPDPETAAAVPADSLRYLALGDSYTIGEAVEEAERWPVQLTERLRAEGVPIAAPEIIAVTGWTTDELAAGIEEADPQGPYDLVSLPIGVNNQYRGRDAEEYREQFRSLLGQAVAFAGGEASRVIVVAIPDWGVTPFAEGRDRSAIAEELDRFNAIAEEEAGARGAAWVDIQPAARAHGAAEVASDGLHPSGAMYTRWTEAALPTARAALGR